MFQFIPSKDLMGGKSGPGLEAPDALLSQPRPPWTEFFKGSELGFGVSETGVVPVLPTLLGCTWISTRAHQHYAHIK